MTGQGWAHESNKISKRMNWTCFFTWDREYYPPSLYIIFIHYGKAAAVLKARASGWSLQQWGYNFSFYYFFLNCFMVLKSEYDVFIQFW